MRPERAPRPSLVPPPPVLPWASLLDRLTGIRCRAVLEPEPGHGKWADFGRCELRRHPRTVDHALERGMYDVRWSTRETAGVSGLDSDTRVRNGAPLTGRALTGIVVVVIGPGEHLEAAWLQGVLLPRLARGALLRFERTRW